MSKLVGIYKYFFTHVFSRPNVVNWQFTFSVFRMVYLPVRYCNCQHVSHFYNMSFNQLHNCIWLLAFVIKHYRPLLYLLRKSLAIYGLISVRSQPYPSKNFFLLNNKQARTKASHSVLAHRVARISCKLNMAESISVEQ